MPTDPAFIAIVIAAALIIGLSKGGLSGTTLVVVPMMTTVVGASTALAISLPLLLVGDGFALLSYWREWDTVQVRLLLPLGVVGTVIGTYIVVEINDTLLRQIIGMLTLVYVAYRGVSAAFTNTDYDPARWVGQLAAFAAGITSALGAAGSPAFTAYYLLKRPEPRIFLGTFTVFFAVSNAVKVPFYITTELLTWSGFLSVVWAIPLVPVGIWGGRQFVKVVDRVSFDRVLLVILTLTGVWLLFA